jgi:hypothetical protein
MDAAWIRSKFWDAGAQPNSGGSPSGKSCIWIWIWTWVGLGLGLGLRIPVRPQPSPGRDAGKLLPAPVSVWAAAWHRQEPCPRAVESSLHPDESTHAGRDTPMSAPHSAALIIIRPGAWFLRGWLNRKPRLVDLGIARGLPYTQLPERLFRCKSTAPGPRTYILTA